MVQHDTYDEEELLTFLGIPVYLIVLAVPAAGLAFFVRWAWRNRASQNVSVRTP